MAGIVRFGAYVPLHRLGKETDGWTAAGERATANFDEDSITMAVAAALDCLEGVDRKQVDGVFFASTSSPYHEKDAAPLIATACDLREDIRTADFTNSLRAGTTALQAALDAVKAGSARNILVTTAEMRTAQPRSDAEANMGDGAAAFLVGNDGVVAEVELGFFMAHEIQDMWRAEGGAYMQTWEDRFIMDEGYLRSMLAAGNEAVKRAGMGAADFARAAIYAPDVRRLTDISRRLGLDDKKQVPVSILQEIGNTGAALVPMMLVSALEEAAPDQRLLVLNYGQGADALVLRTTSALSKDSPNRGVKGFLASKKMMPSYQQFLRWRGLLDVAPAARRPPLPVPSASAMYREQEQNIRFYGVKCRRCGTPQYPIQRVCAVCRTKDEFDPYRFSDKRATMFTYSMDYLGPTLDSPLVVGIIDFEGGGRCLIQMTDRNIDDVKPGMPLELSFRLLHVVEGIHNYYWKCIPVRGS
ncbi:MAG: OB-fold domain-containing protein [Dehalococcoidia bacterium]|nr:OB-fold domain-containing protein [Dehalococcoidia bacterium]